MVIDSLLEIRDMLNWVDWTDNRDFISQSNSSILESKKKAKRPPSTDPAWSIDKYLLWGDKIICFGIRLRIG